MSGALPLSWESWTLLSEDRPSKIPSGKEDSRLPRRLIHTRFVLFSNMSPLIELISL